MRRVVTVSGSGDTVDFVDGSRPAIASDGRVVVAPVAATRGTLAAFDAQGKLTAVFGRAGQRPGEFGVVQGRPQIGGFGFGPGDSIYAADMGQLRMQVFSPAPSVTFARQFRIPRQFIYFQVTPLGLVSQTFKGNPLFYSAEGRQVRTVKAAGMLDIPPRLFAFDGRPIAAFGEFTIGATERDFFGNADVVDSTQAWFAYSKRYRLELRDATGNVLRTLNRNVTWFPPDTMPWKSIFERPPPANIMDVSVGTDGNVWVVIRRANRDWATRRSATPPVVTLRPGMPIQMLPPVPMLDIYETVLEVLDPKDGRLIASRDLPGDYYGFIAPDMLYQRSEDAAGMISIHMWRVTLATERGH